jgi:hypothetical protein
MNNPGNPNPQGTNIVGLYRMCQKIISDNGEELFDVHRGRLHFDSFVVVEARTPVSLNPPAIHIFGRPPPPKNLRSL